MQLTASMMRTHRLNFTPIRPSVRPVLGPGKCSACTDPIGADRYPYTTDTFNNPQNMWGFVSVSGSFMYFTTCLRRHLAKANFSPRSGRYLRSVVILSCDMERYQSGNEQWHSVLFSLYRFISRWRSSTFLLFGSLCNNFA